MSDDFKSLLLILIVFVVAWAVITKFHRADIEDLQRRVGQLEQNEKKMVDILDKLARHAASESEQVRR